MLRRCLGDVTEAYNVLSDEKNVSSMMSLTLQVCRRAFPRRLQRQAAQGGFGGFGGNGSFSGSYSSNGGPFYTSGNFDFENGSGDMDDISLNVRRYVFTWWQLRSRGSYSTGGAGGFGGNSADWSNFTGGSARGRSSSRKGSDVMADLTISFDEAVLDARNLFRYRIRPQARFPICPSIFRQGIRVWQDSQTLKDRAIRAETVVQPEMCFST